MHLLSLLLQALFSATHALADYGVVTGAVESVGGVLPFSVSAGGGSASGFVEIASGVVDRFRPLLTIVAVLVIVIYGYRMIIGQEDDVITKARAVMTGTMAGLIMVYLIDPFIAAFYGNGSVATGGMAGGVAILSIEVSGIINWALTIVASLAILMMVLSAVKAIGQGASEEGIGNMRKTAFSVVFGIVLLVFRFILSDGFIASTTNPSPMLAAALRPVSYVMGMLAMAGVIVVTYAGFQCVFSMGNEEAFSKAKGLLSRAGVGVLVIILSLGLVNFVIMPGLE